MEPETIREIEKLTTKIVSLATGHATRHLSKTPFDQGAMDEVLRAGCIIDQCTKITLATKGEMDTTETDKGYQVAIHYPKP